MLLAIHLQGVPGNPQAPFCPPQEPQQAAEPAVAGLCGCSEYAVEGWAQLVVQGDDVPASLTSPCQHQATTQPQTVSASHKLLQLLALYGPCSRSPCSSGVSGTVDGGSAKPCSPTAVGWNMQHMRQGTQLR
jgi:hypothetical protein